MNRPQVAVIGAGAVGLSTAVCIQEQIPEVDVTLIAEKFTKDTLSHGAGGFFRPECNIGPTFDLLKQWCKDGFEHYMDVMRSKDADKAGIQLVSGYHLSSISRECIQNSILQELLPVYRPLTCKEMQMFPEEFKYGFFYTSVVIDCRRYLPWMMEIFQRKGRVEVRKVQNLSDLGAKYDVVVNCTGLGAKNLVNDINLTPIRGQALKVKAPWIKHFFMFDSGYVLPGVDYVTLGGIKEYGDWNTNADPISTSSIWKKCLKVIPSLEHAPVEVEWVGLRPYRQPVRVEKDTIQGQNGPIKVVHNYGHGAHGISLPGEPQNTQRNWWLKYFWRKHPNYDFCCIPNVTMRERMEWF